MNGSSIGPVFWGTLGRRDTESTLKAKLPDLCILNSGRGPKSFGVDLGRQLLLIADQRRRENKRGDEEDKCHRAGAFPLRRITQNLKKP